MSAQQVRNEVAGFKTDSFIDHAAQSIYRKVKWHLILFKIHLREITSKNVFFPSLPRTTSTSSGATLRGRWESIRKQK